MTYVQENAKSKSQRNHDITIETRSIRSEGRRSLIRWRWLSAGILCLLASALLPAVSRAQDPVFVIPRDESTIKFSVKASVALEGVFDKWDATLTYPSTDVTSGVLDVKIQAASVDTGSGMKDGKLKGQDKKEKTKSDEKRGKNHLHTNGLPGSPCIPTRIVCLGSSQ